MAGYRIVLNLTGNASRKVNSLANDLARADASATSLAGSLSKVAMASHTIKPLDKSNYARSRTAPRPQPTRRPRTQPEQAQPQYTRHRANRILSYGVGGSIGGFSGRLGSIWQPDANGKLLGMDAAKLVKGANITAVVGSLLATIGKAVVKVVAASTIAPIAIGGGGLMMAISALQSEGFAEGVRLISRRHQAKLGLGADYERGQANADFLASSYGFDRSTALSSINVLSGMGIGGTDRKLTTGEATGLTKVGGLISQQSGVSFERVMTNIQQLLVQTTPHVRDIREMLNQAPILGKYAMKDMDEKGVKGVDVRTWLKDSGNIMSALKRYQADLASNSGMQARGEIALAQQDFWATIAGNKPFWEYVGVAGSDVIGSAGTSINNLLTSLANNDSFKVMVANIETIFDTFAEHGGEFMQKLTDFIDKMSQKFGLPMGDPAIARDKVGKVNAIDALMGDKDFKAMLIDLADRKGQFKDLPAGSEARALAEETFLTAAGKRLKKSKDFRESILGEYDLSRTSNLTDDIKNLKWSDISVQNIGNKLLAGSVGSIIGDLRYVGTDPNKPLTKGLWGTNFSVEEQNKRIAELSVTRTANPTDSTFRNVTQAAYDILSGKETKNPISQVASYVLNTNKAYDEIYEMLRESSSTGSVPVIAGKATDEGKDLTGFNRDRKSLEIHFNAPLVEWTNTMETTSPQETVEAISENIEQIASAAIQKALLGASNKMSSRFY